MDHQFLMFVIICFCLMLAASLLAFLKSSSSRRRLMAGLPPGPRGVPVVGNLHQLGRLAHRSLAALAREHGPLMTVRLGWRTTVVVSSSAAARVMFRDHDAALAGRAVYEAMRFRSSNEGSIITAQVGPEWRMLRRLCATGFFAAARLDAMQGVRSRCVDALLRTILNSSGRRAGDVVVRLGDLLFRAAFGHTGNLVMSADLLGSKEGGELYFHAGKIMEIVGKPNAADFFPVLRRLDPQGVRRGAEVHIGRALEIVGGFVTERVERRRRRRSVVDSGGGHGGEEEKKKDLLDVLLEFEGDGVDEPRRLPFETITKVIVEIFIAGIDTTASTMEWAMAELIRCPDAMRKAQAELRRRSVPASGLALDERDAMSLPYLNAVIKETLRLHPPIPCLVPHKALQPCEMLGYCIPAGTQIFVNVWAIGRDPRTWEDPHTFRPERFVADELRSNVDYKGHHYELLPFGSGRRKCPAIPLVSRLIPLVVGSLVSAFDWDLPGGADPATMDMAERMGITLRKAVPLEVVAVPYVAAEFGKLGN